MEKIARNFDIESFVENVLHQDNTSPYFWDLFALATGDMEHYYGPKSENDFYNKVKKNPTNHKLQDNDYKLLSLYQNKNHKNQSDCLEWVRIIAPLVARSDQNLGYSGTQKLNCFYDILFKSKDFKNSKLRYEILTCVIENLEKFDIRNEYVFNLYSVARWMRSTCNWAQKSNDMNVVETLMQDRLLFLQQANKHEIKLKAAHDIFNMGLKQLEIAIKTIKDEQKLQQKVQEICNNMRRRCAHVGESGQGFVWNVHDVFNPNNIMNIPGFLQKHNGRTK